MRIAIVGAGIVGVTTAHELALEGHEVTVFERRAVVASEASFANGGIVTPAGVGAWASPGLAGLRLGGWRALAHLPWLWRCWRSSRPPVARAHQDALRQLASLSQARLLELTRTLQLEYEQRPGYLVLLRAERELNAARPWLALLQEWGVPHELADAARCRTIEPGLHAGTALHAGVHLPQEGAGNCRQFAQLLKAQAQRLGARFQFGATVRGLRPGAPVTLQFAQQPDQTFDAVVLCAGAQAAAVLAGSGLKLPLVAVHGYSVTAPLRHVDGLPPPGPRAALRDARRGVTLTRLGQRLRVAGVAEIGGRHDQLALGALRSLYGVLDDWFPGAVLARDAQHWKGARAMLPDGPPVVGESGAPGVWLNLGHGGSGWALACGSACVLSARMAGRPAPLDTRLLTLPGLRPPLS